MKSAEAYREVYCWKAINCLEVWGHVLAAHGPSTQLQPLVYPVVQLLLGAARLVPSARWFPIRLRLVRCLVGIAAATRVYVPVAGVLLEVLAWPGFAKPAYGTGASPNLLLQLRLSKNNLKLPATQQELVEQVCAFFFVAPCS
jgi:nucleolar complex protein 2